MKSAVLELQNVALDNSVDLSEALRKALAISTKLGLAEFRQWVALELEGYSKVDYGNFPEYRIIGSQLIAKNPFHGHIPYLINDNETMENITTIFVSEPIQALVYLLKNRKGTLEYPLPAKWHSALIHAQGAGPMEVTRIVSPNSIEAIIDRVRTQLLNFSLELETRGILGDGISFSQLEKEKASEMNQNINIGFFQGVLGDVSNSSIKQNNEITINKEDFESLKNYLINIGISSDDIVLLKQALQEDNLPSETKSFGAKVSLWLGKMVTKAASGTWSVGVAAAGNLLGEALKKFYGM